MYVPKSKEIYFLFKILIRKNLCQLDFKSLTKFMHVLSFKELL